MEPLKQVYARWGDRIEFVDVVIRQAHPGPGALPYRDIAQKQRDAERYQRDEGIPWTVAVDEITGATHQVYGGLADPTYLIDSEGRVAYYNAWTFAPSLHKAIQELVAQGGRGVVRGGVDRVPHMGPALTDGWRGLRRSLPQSYLELEQAAPGAASATWLGHQLKPVLAPLTLRSGPLSLGSRLAVGATAAGLALMAGYLWNRSRASDAP